MLTSETVTVVQRLMDFTNIENGLMVKVCWSGLPESEDTLEPFAKLYEGVPQLQLKLNRRNNIPQDLVAKAHKALNFP